MNQEKITIIKLGGQLGKKFGKVHEFYISSPAEAVRALCSQVEGFQEYMTDPDNKTQYKVFVQDKQIDPEEELHNPTGSKEVRISPVVQGAKRGGLFQIVLGAALIALSFAIPPGWVIGKVAVKGLVMSLGTSMALGGIAQLLSPQPRLHSMDPPENTPNKSFAGPVNTVGSGGHPVPLAYGRVITGSATISAGMYSSDIVR